MRLDECPDLACRPGRMRRPCPARPAGACACASTSIARSTASGAGSWRGAGSTTRHSDCAPAVCVDDLAEHRGRNVQVDAAGPAGHRGADRPGDAAADVLGAVHPVGGLRERFRRRHLVEFLVVAAFEVDDVAIAGTRDLHHRKAVRRGVGQRDQPVEEPGPETVRQMPGFFVRKPAAAAAWPASLS